MSLLFDIKGLGYSQRRLQSALFKQFEQDGW